MTTTDQDRIRDRRPVVVGAVVTALVHLSALLLFAMADGDTGHADTTRMRQFYLCDGKTRCGFREIKPVMRGIEVSLPGQIDAIEAIVIPRLGLAKKVRGMPKLVKYEAPAKAKDGINIKKKNEQPKPVKHKAVKKKKADLDKRRKKKPEPKLLAILGAVEDHDPRKRATALDRIVGLSSGSVHGSGTDARPGNIYGGKIAVLFKKHFVVPTSIPKKTLKGLKLRVKIIRLAPNGDITEYRVLKTSGNSAFDLASQALIRKFVGREGGKLRLPAPDPKTLGYINQHGIILDLDGSRFQQ
jgi:TonB C terminal